MRGKSGMAMRLVCLLLLVVGCIEFWSPGTARAAEKDELVIATMWECLPLSMKARRGKFFNESEILDTLVKMDDNMALIPGLATSWKRESPTEWVFTLRSGVKFHDGSPFNAEAARFSLEKVITMLPYAKGMLDIARIEVLGEDKLKIVTNKPFASLANQLTDGFTGIYGQASFNQEGKYVKPIGTGPYRLVEYIKEDRTIVEAFDGYWGDPPAIKRVVYRYIPDHNTRVLALESGEVDLALNIPPADVARLKKDPGYKVYEEPCAGLYYMAFNCRKGVFSDPRARLAVNYLIDRDTLVSQALDGVGIPAWEFFTPTVDWAPKDAPAYALDPGKAAELFGQAGLTREDDHWVKNGQPVKLSLISYSSRTEMSLLTEAIGGMMQNNGFNVDVNLYTWGGMLDLVKKGAFDAYIVYWTPELIGHPDLHLRAHLHSATNLDYSGFKNEKLDMLLERGRELDYGPEARSTYLEALKIIHDESPVAPLVHKVYVAASTARLDGFRIHPSGFFLNIKACSLD